MPILMQYFLPNAFMPRVSYDIFVQCVVVVVVVVVVMAVVIVPAVVVVVVVIAVVILRTKPLNYKSYHAALH